MNTEDQKKIGVNEINVQDSLNGPLLDLKIECNENTIIPNTNQLVIYVDKSSQSSPTNERKEYIFDLSTPLQYLNSTSDVFFVKFIIENGIIKLKTYVERNIGEEQNVQVVLQNSYIEEVNSSLINLFEGINYIYTNYINASIEFYYPKSTTFNKQYANDGVLYTCLDSIKNFSVNYLYFKDAFTKTGNKLDLAVDNACVESITSKNNSFYLDEFGNLVVNSISTNSGSILNHDEIVDLIYPIGSIYLSTNNANPGTLFGGTWQQIKDKFLLGCGDTYALAATGGEATHVLSTNEIPSHSHTWSQTSCTNPGNHTHIVGADKDGGPGSNRYTVHITSNNTAYGQQYSPASGGAGSHTHTIGGSNTNTGGGAAHNNMPPYITVSMWKRVS